MKIQGNTVARGNLSRLAHDNSLLIQTYVLLESSFGLINRADTLIDPELVFESRIAERSLRVIGKLSFPCSFSFLFAPPTSSPLLHLFHHLPGSITILHVGVVLPITVSICVCISVCFCMLHASRVLRLAITRLVLDPACASLQTNKKQTVQNSKRDGRATTTAGTEPGRGPAC